MTRTLSVTLDSHIVYVSGTVNGAAATWTLVDAAWQTTVPRSPDDIYLVELTAISSTGGSTTVSLTLYYGLHLITDRTRADADRARYLRGLWDEDGFNGTAAELAEWMAGLKGAYNAADLNRVESAVAYLRDRLSDECGTAVDVQIKLDWHREDKPRISDAETYLGNIRKLRAALTLPTETPELPTDMIELWWYEANDMERVLEIVDETITKIRAAWLYSGELYGGEI